MQDDILYKDKLIEVSTDSILLKNFYFPIIGSKRIRFDRIKSVTAVAPSLFTGRWRIWGTGDFTTWFPLDFARPKRDLIFLLSFGKVFSVGFTAEDSVAVRKIFEETGHSLFERQQSLHVEHTLQSVDAWFRRPGTATSGGVQF